MAIFGRVGVARALMLLVCLVFAHGAVRAEAASKPNIVYILCDDLGYGDVHCLNTSRGKIATPCIDKLASQSMTFTDAHSGSSVCTPTRYGIMTGRYAWRSRLQHGVVTGHADPLIAADRLTVASMLRQQGYNTAIIGKWHLNYNYVNPDGAKAAGVAPNGEDGDDSPVQKKKGKREGGNAGVRVGTMIPDGPVTRGFDYFFGFHHAREMRWLVENDRIIKDLPTIEMLPLLTKKAVSYINEHAAEAKAGKPFFLYIPWSAPHTPIDPAPQWQGKSGISPYADFVMQTDWSTGQVLGALDANGLTDNTLVIFTSDNGCSKAANFKTLNAAGHYPSADMRGSKADIWDGGHRVAFFVRWPGGGVKPGSTCEQTICHTDLMATAAEITGATYPPNAAEDSVSFLPALSGKPIPADRPAIVHHSISGKFAIRQGPWKLILTPGSGGWSDPSDAAARKKGWPDIQLYRMDKDLGEEQNLQAEDHDEVQRLLQVLQQIVEQGRSTPGPAQSNDVAVDILKGAKVGE
ncbi:MAG: sulfatase-like hydrolase/transferase [Phycisphaera sp.]|nr:sulfatase-like hydrolase/transferase [Phycisphaera sp.]